jgi:hypothetical protein
MLKMKKLGWIFVAIICAAGPWATNAQAQGSRKDDVVFNSRGQPLAGASVRVCASTAGTTSPCSPLASIFSDNGLTQALANPISTDGLGNYSFYAAPGRYVIEVSGPAITTHQQRDVILPSDPSMTSSSALSAFSLALAGGLSVAGNASVTGTLSVAGGSVPSTNTANTWTANQTFSTPVTLNSAGGNVAQKYACSNGNVQYVDSLIGSDSNDGCSAGTAKQYVATAWTTLYNSSGNSGAKHTGGTIFASDDGGYPIYWDSGHHTARIIGPNDPNWQGTANATQTIGGMIWYTQLSGVHLVGQGCSSAGNGSAEKPQCRFAFGAGDSTGVGLQISGTNTPMTFENIRIQDAKNPLALGLDSNQKLNENDNTAEVSFRNYYFTPSNVTAAGYGPGVLIGSTVFEDYFWDGAIAGNLGEMWNLASCTRTSNVTTCTTSATNGLQAGDLFYLRGTSDSTFVVSTNLNVDSTTQFHFTQNAPNGSSTGGVVFTCRHAAMCVNVGGQQSASPIIYGDMHTSNGPIFMAVGQTSFTPVIHHVLSESLPSDDAALVVVGMGGSTAAYAGLDMQDLQVADNATGSTNIQMYAEPAGFNNTPIAVGSSAGGLGVPGGTVAAKEGTGYNTPCEQTRNVGFIGTKICGEQDVIWRSASPALSQFSQYSVGNTNPSHWFGGQTSSYASGVVTPIAGPAGFTDAGQASQNIAAAGTGSQAVADGDIVIAFSMWRAPSGLPTSAVGGLGNPSNPFVFTTGGGCSGVYFQDISGDASTMLQLMPYGGNVGGPNLSGNEWERGFGVFKMRGSGTCTNIHWEALGDSTHPMQLYMPMMYYIPAGTISDAEAAAIAYYGSAAPFQMSAKVAWSPAWLYGRRLGVLQQYTNGVGATALVSGDFLLSGGWGGSPAIGSITGTDQGFTATVTAGSSPAANPTVTLTFHDGAWPNAPIFTCSSAPGGSGTPQLWLVSTTTTALTATYNGTPSASSTYPVTCVGIGR